MKGIIFTEFLELVETRFSADMVDDIIDDAALPSGGVYTSVGTYDHQEMVALLVGLSRRSGIGIPVLLREFGSYLFSRLVTLYPAFFQDVPDSFAFLNDIEKVIHAEVRKLYPDAELPRFDISHPDPATLVMDYRSSRHLEDLAEGMIRGCIDHFSDDVTMSRESREAEGTRYERFVLRRAAA